MIKNGNKRIKVLFVHNTITWYRIPFFNILTENIDIKYIFTRNKLSEKIYNIRSNEMQLIKKPIIIKSSPLRYFELIKNILINDFDIIVAPPMDSVGEYIDSLIVFVIAKLSNKKVIYFWEKWEAFDDIPIKKRLKNLLQRIVVKGLIKKMDMCICAGTKSREYFERLGVNKNKIVTIYNASGVNKPKIIYDIRLKHNIPQHKKIILYFGRIEKRKGLDYLIRVFKRIEEKYDNVFLLICGEGNFKDECIKLSNSLGVKNICFTGSINPDDRYLYLSQSNVFVLPSYFYNGIPEAWGLTLNEAIQCGLPVISTTAVGAAYDIIKNGINGFMVKQKNEDELYFALIRILENKLPFNFSFNSKKIYNDNFNYNKMAEGFLNVFYECIIKE